MKKNKYSISYIINCAILAVIAIIALYPVIFLFSLSLSNSYYVMANKVFLFPRGLTLYYYKVLIRNSFFFSSYYNTIKYTVLGTGINVIFTVLLAYPLSKKEFIFQKFLLIMVTITMFIKGGMIPSFLLVRSLGMYDTIWAILIPGAISVWNLILCRTYFQSLPRELEEAAIIDGCGRIKLLSKIILPLSMPIIAVLIVYYAVSHWNSYLQPLIYLNDKDKYPIQVYLRLLMDTGTSTEEAERMAYEEGIYVVSESFNSACLFASLLPMMIVYPLLQKYFVKGIMVGSLKG